MASQEVMNEAVRVAGALGLNSGVHPTVTDFIREAVREKAQREKMVEFSEQHSGELLLETDERG